MTKLDAWRKAAIVEAAQVHRRMDGTFSRRGLTSLAETNGISVGHLREIIKQDRAARDPRPVRLDSEHIRAEAAQSAIVGLDHKDCLLVACSVGAGNRKKAHAWAQKHLSYVKSYRQFLRDLDTLAPALLRGAEGGWSALVHQRVYMTNVFPHRNHTWFMDHTKASIYVLPDRGDIPFRPWLTNIVDGSTNMYMALEAWEGNPDTERVAQALTRAAVGDRVERDGDMTIGGLPIVLVFDNAAEHLAHAMRQGCLRLGIIGSPTTPHHSWENGICEVSHQCVERDFLADLPGYMKGGTTATGDPRFSPASAPIAGAREDAPHKSQIPLLRFSMFRALLEEYRNKRNESMLDSRGLSPLLKWRTDPTPLTPIDQNMMLANLTAAGDTRVVNKSGIRFRSRDYISAEIGAYRGKEVSVRYLTSVTAWIEVFHGSTYVGRAWDATRFTEAERTRFVAERARVEKRHREIEKRATGSRAHLAMAINEGWDPESLPEPANMNDLLRGNHPDEAPLPVIVSPARQRPTSKRERESTLDSVADRLISEQGFRLDGDAS
jgi:transposase InsO family protein